MAIPGIAAAQEYSDPNAYVVDPVNEPARSYAQSQMLDDNTPWKTTVAPFYPQYYGYDPATQDTVVNDEHRITGGEQFYDMFTGERMLDFLQARIPEATSSNTGSPTEVQPTNDTPTVFQKTYNKTERFGNTSIVSAGYQLDASITSTTATSTAAKKVEALGEGKAFGTVFGFEKEIVRGRAYVSGQQGGSNSGNAALFLMGSQVWGTSLYATFNPAPISWNRTFFSANKTFWVGPVPVNVKLNVSGGASLTVNGEIGPTVARLNVQPAAYANLTGSASASVIVAGVGVDVSMKLLDLKLPSYGELFWPYCTLDWKLQSNLVLTNTLGGKVSAWAKVSLIFFKKTWRVTIAEWTGINRNWTLLNIYGSKVLGLC
jgi:hypothetical protein